MNSEFGAAENSKEILSFLRGIGKASTSTDELEKYLGNANYHKATPRQHFVQDSLDFRKSMTLEMVIAKP